MKGSRVGARLPCCGCWAGFLLPSLCEHLLARHLLPGSPEKLHAGVHEAWPRVRPVGAWCGRPSICSTLRRSHGGGDGSCRACAQVGLPWPARPLPLHICTRRTCGEDTNGQKPAGVSRCCVQGRVLTELRALPPSAPFAGRIVAVLQRRRTLRRRGPTGPTGPTGPWWSGRSCGPVLGLLPVTDSATPQTGSHEEKGWFWRWVPEVAGQPLVVARLLAAPGSLCAPRGGNSSMSSEGTSHSSV